jgi:hypothetical protein
LKLAQELHRPVQERGHPMLKVQRTANGKVVFAVSGRLEADSLSALAALLALEPLTRGVILELKDLVLVDRDAIGFLRACAEKGIELRNCPQYVRIWLASDEGGT